MTEKVAGSPAQGVTPTGWLAIEAGSLTTVTEKTHLLLFPHQSVAVHVTDVWPGENSELDGGTQLTVALGSHVSDMIGRKTTRAVHRPGSGFVTMSVGQKSNTGAVVSLVQVNATLVTALMLPQVSLAVIEKVRVVRQPTALSV